MHQGQIIIRFQVTSRDHTFVFLFFIWARQPVKGHDSKKGASRGSGASAISLPCMRQLAWKKTLLLTVKPSPDKAWSAVYYNDYPT